MKRLYEVTGVVTYAHVFSVEVEASSQYEARRIVSEMDFNDNASAELQEVLIDKPVEIKHDPRRP